jgi:hypothetical protein
MLPSENRRAICDVTFLSLWRKPIVSARAKGEYVQAIYQRYRHAGRPEKRRILDEFCQVAGYHRKHAIRLLNGPAPGAARPPRRRAATSRPAVIEALRAIWAAAGYPWSLRLKALRPLGHLHAGSSAGSAGATRFWHLGGVCADPDAVKRK